MRVFEAESKNRERSCGFHIRPRLMNTLLSLHTLPVGKLKACHSYQRRMSLLETCSDTVLVEYDGEPPLENAPHGLARHNALEYVRGKPKVLDNVRAAVTTSRAAPKQI